MNRFDLERYGRTHWVWRLVKPVGSTCYVRGGLGEHAGAVADGVMCVVSCRGAVRPDAGRVSKGVVFHGHGPHPRDVRCCCGVGGCGVVASRLGGPTSTAETLTFAGVCAGAALLPDLDTGQSTVSRSFGPLSKALAKGIDALS